MKARCIFHIVRQATIHVPDVQDRTQKGQGGLTKALRMLSNCYGNIQYLLRKLFKLKYLLVYEKDRILYDLLTPTEKQETALPWAQFYLI